jgi:peptidoglycan-associated lipoprotein
MMRNKYSIALVLLLALTVTACGGRKGVKEDAAGAAMDEQGVTASGVGDGSGTSVYFEFDSAAVNADSRAVIEAHAQYLIDNPSVTAVLEGHADERGTREYNLALGERRSKAVADIMSAYGVALGRLQTISYGEERPEELGSDESAWALNRRVIILR